MALVLVVPMVIVPFVEVPVPAVNAKLPPVEVVPDSLPPLRVNNAPVPELVVFTPGRTVRVVWPVPVVKS